MALCDCYSPRAGSGGRCRVTGSAALRACAGHPPSARWRPTYVRGRQNDVIAAQTQRAPTSHHRGTVNTWPRSSGSTASRLSNQNACRLSGKRIGYTTPQSYDPGAAVMLLDAAGIRPARGANSSPRAASPRRSPRLEAWRASMSAARGRANLYQSAGKYRAILADNDVFPPIFVNIRRVRASNGCPRTSATREVFRRKSIRAAHNDLRACSDGTRGGDDYCDVLFQNFAGGLPETTSSAGGRLLVNASGVGGLRLRSSTFRREPGRAQQSAQPSTM